LVLRDLGYFALPVLRQIQLSEAFFLSRLRFGVILRDPKTKQPSQSTSAFCGAEWLTLACWVAWSWIAQDDSKTQAREKKASLS